MERKLSGKHILVVKGALLADVELRDTLVRHGARVTSTANLVSAFDLVARKEFDGAVVDHSLHNEAFDLCTEFQALGIPYLSANCPHRLQAPGCRKKDAEVTAARLAHQVEMAVDDVHAFTDLTSPDAAMSEVRAF